MRHPKNPWPCLLAFAALPATPAFAQVVSPAGCANVEGSVNNLIPFLTPPNTPRFTRRYLQIHSDLPSQAFPIRQLSFRSDRGSGTWTGVQTVNLELWMGLGYPLAQTSFVFASNYRPSTRRQMLAPTNVNFGPQGLVTSGPTPNPFLPQLSLVLSAPFLYPGRGTGASLVWEVMVHGGSLTGTVHHLDADAGSQAQATPTPTGSGCTVTGRTQPMGLQLAYWDSGGVLQLNHQITDGPANASTWVAFGATNPGWRIPGLCSPLHTDLLVLLPIGTTNASGVIDSDMAGAATLVLPNTLGGAQLFVQAHSLWLGAPHAIPLANSGGQQVVLPMPQTTKLVGVARIYNNNGGPGAVQALFTNPATHIGYGLVTEFQ